MGEEAKGRGEQVGEEVKERGERSGRGMLKSGGTKWAREVQE